MLKRIFILILIAAVMLTLDFYSFCQEQKITDSVSFDTKTDKEKDAAEEKPLELSGALNKGVRTVKVEAFQYGFKPDPIVVKKGEKVRLEIVSKDVVHGLAIKEFKVNVPLRPLANMTAEFKADKIGEFTIYCSIYCGSGHGKMNAKLKVIE